MKSKQGYHDQKSKYRTGNWLKYYFQKFTCRKQGELSYPEIIQAIKDPKDTEAVFPKEFAEKVHNITGDITKG